MNPRHALSSLVVAVGVAMLLGACGGSSGSSSASTTSTSASSQPPPSASAASAIAISNFKFSPTPLTVKAGASVSVTNNDSAPHTVTADDGKSFDTGNVNQGASGSFTAPKAGSYPYHCTVHPFMHGTLKVQ